MSGNPCFQLNSEQFEVQVIGKNVFQCKSEKYQRGKHLISLERFIL